MVIRVRKEIMNMEIPAVLGTILVWDERSPGTSNHLYLKDSLSIAAKPTKDKTRIMNIVIIWFNSIVNEMFLNVAIYPTQK